MKKGLFKLLSMILCIVFASSFMLVGCGTTSTDGKKDQTSQTITKSETKQEQTTQVIEKKPEDYKGEITVWAHDDFYRKFDPYFSKMYPNIKITGVQIPDAEIRTKLKAIMSAGVTPPDIVYLAVGLWKEMSDLTVFENLSAAPYNADQYLNKQYKYIRDISKNSKGEVIGLSFQSTPAGFFYRRSLAKKWLGTDDPAEVSKFFDSWDSIFSAGEKVYRESQGKLTLLSSWEDIYNIQRTNTRPEWIKEETLTLDKEVYKVFDLCKNARQKNVEAKLNPWSPEWMDNIYTGKYSIGLVTATWMMAYVIKPNAPDTKGDWGFAKAMKPMFNGGTWTTMMKDSKNKELAWEYLKFVNTNEDFLFKFTTEIGDFSPNIAVNEKLSQTFTSDPWWGGQNIISAFSDIASKAEPNVYKYESVVIGSLYNFIGEHLNNNMPKDEAIKKMVEDFKSKMPDVKVIEEK